MSGQTWERRACGYGGLELDRPGTQVEPVMVSRRRSTKPRIESALHPALHGNDDQPPIFSQALHLTCHIVTGDHVEHHIHATPIGDSLDFHHESPVSL